MCSRFTELTCKEVICLCDGRRLGFISDVSIDPCDGKIIAIIVPAPCRFFGVLGRGDDFVIPWQCIKRIGPDIVLVDINPSECCKPRTRKSDFLLK